MRAAPVIFALLLAAPIGRPATGAQPGDPFARTALLPADVTLYVHADDAAALRRAIDDRPIERWIEALGEGWDLSQVWSAAARQMGLEPAQLFDLWLGRSVTIAARGAPPAGWQWVVISEVDPAQVGAAELRVRPRLLAPRGGVSIRQWPEQSLLLGRRGRVQLIGPAGAPQLFDEVVARLREDAPATGTLAGEESIQRARTIGGGRFGMMVRHAAPTGGWSVIAGDLHGDRVVLRQAAQFDHAPFERRITRMECRFPVLPALEERCLMVVAEPNDVGDGLLDTYALALLGEPIVDESMRDRLGAVRIVAVGEEQGRLRTEPADILSPTLALCLQVQGDGAAMAALDDRMVRLVRQINRLGEGAFLVELQPDVLAKGCRPRCVDLSPAASHWLPGGFPIMPQVNLSWTLADGPSGAWYVIATHQAHLDDVVGSLEKPQAPEARAVVGRFDSVGSADGMRIARHLRTWMNHAGAIVEPEAVGEFQEMLDLAAHFAEGIARCRWKLARPGAEQMQLEVELELAPRESAEE